jgi:transcriptional regulator with XRE-family HTH domain
VRLGTFLRRLREGYGYTLRKVEERAVAYGEVIDNSQLSRFEKGKALPSFEKLRALASVFNVPVQHFSDVLDLEEFEPFKPIGGSYDELLAAGAAAFASGEHGRAYVTFERALEVAQEEPTHPAAAARMVEARWRMAVASKALGKLFLTEHELREVLKDARVPPPTRVRVLLQLLSCTAGRRLPGACWRGGTWTLACSGRGLAGRGATRWEHPARQRRHGRRWPTTRRRRPCWTRWSRGPGGGDAPHRADQPRGCMVALGGRYEEAWPPSAGSGRRAAAYRRIAALASRGWETPWPGRCDGAPLFQESDGQPRGREVSRAVSSTPSGAGRWRAREGHGTREKIAFGRLRHLQARLERDSPRWMRSTGVKEPEVAALPA